MRVLMLRGNDLTIEQIDRPRPGPGQVLAKVLACGICGSDLHFARFGAQLAADAKAADGAVGRDVDLDRGVVMGHEFVAEVVQAGAGAERWQPGARVTCMPVVMDSSAPRGHQALGYSSNFSGAYGEFVVLSAALLLPVPDGVPNAVVATTEPCAVGLHAVREARVKPGETALIIGAGPIGLMSLLWLKHEGVERVIVSEYAAERRALATRLGADVVIDPAKDKLVTQLEVNGGLPPVVFECVGVGGTLQLAMDLVATRGRVIVVGVCMVEDRIKPSAGINKHLTMQFVLGYSPQEYAESLDAIASGAVNTSPLITRTVSLDELPAAFQSLANPRDCKVMLQFK